jgi:hypothetical protein
MTDIATRIQTIAANSLPDKNNIKHMGYRIALMARAKKFQRCAMDEWQSLANEARKIPNDTDRAYVLGILAECAELRDAQFASGLLKEAESIASDLPCTIDRIDIYTSLAERADAAGLPTKPYLIAAWKATAGLDGPGVRERSLNIIDTAYKQDPDLAAYLATLNDEDPAREAERERIKKHLGKLQNRRKLLDANSEGLSIESIGDELPEHCWRSLGSLNANRIAPLSTDKTRELLKRAGNYDLEQAYPIFALAIENLNHKFSRTQEAGATIRPILESTLLTARLAERVASIRRGERPKAAIIYDPDLEVRPESSIIIRGGEREKAISFLRKWFSSNASEYIKICDPYFGSANLDLIQLIYGSCPGCRVEVLTSRKNQNQEELSKSWDEVYRIAWRRLSDQDPPDTEIVIVGLEGTGDSPIHDRWILTRGSGIRMGTSFGSLGLQKDSDLSILAKEEAHARESELDLYLQRKKKECQGSRLSYTLFSL